MAGVNASEASNSSQSMSLMDSLSRSLSNSRSRGSSFGTSYVDPAQARARAQLFGQAMETADPGAASAAARSATGRTMPGLSRDFRTLGGMVDPSRYIADQGAVLQQDLGRMFRDEINPAIRGQAMAAGGFGGGRQGVAEGVAAGQLAGEYASGLSDIRREGFGLALDASAQRGALADQMLGLELAPFEAGLGQLGQLAEILGPATVLSRSGSRQRSRSRSRSRSGSRARSRSQSAGESGSGGFSLW